jgi:transposase
MMGTKIRNFAPLPDLSLEDLVPKDNFYRRLEATLDLSFVRDLVEDCYACSGRPSVDPVVFFRLQLVMFFENIRSERQLMAVAADRLSIRWFLGYDLNEPLPDHSSLTRIRERYGLEIFKGFFEEIVQMCVEAGLVRGTELFFDATRVDANASMDSLAPRFAVEAHLSELFEDSPGPGNGAVEAPRTKPTAFLPTADDERLTETNAAKLDWISRHGKQDREVRGKQYRRTADFRASTTDPDATPMRLGGSKKTRLGYQTHYVVDGGKARVILSALVTPAEVMENQPMLDLLWRTLFRWQLRPQHVTGDGAYGTLENVAAVEKAGIRAYVALPHSGKRPSFFAKDDFLYDTERDVYVCPGGELLRPLGHQKERTDRDRRRRKVTYRAKASACNACPLKPKCTTNNHGRNLTRGPEERYLDRVRAYRKSWPYEKALRKRKVWVEPLFAEAKEWHGMRRFRLRRLRTVNTEALMVAAGQNIKRLVGASRRGPRSLPQAAALHFPEPPFSSSRRYARRRQRCVLRRRRRSFSTRWAVFGALRRVVAFHARLIPPPRSRASSTRRRRSSMPSFVVVCSNFVLPPSTR